MSEVLKIRLFYLLSAGFILCGALALANEFYWVALIPPVLLVFTLAIFSIDRLILLIVFLTPLSVNLEDKAVRLAVSLPAEPLIFGTMVLFFMKLVYDKKFDKKIVAHPISIVILFNVAWMVFTTATSEMPIVSIKYVLARIWFVSVFFFLATQLFRNFQNIKKFIWLYAVSLTGVIFYTTYRHAQHDFARKPAEWVMTPFYNDHTGYAAIIALFLPVLIAFTFNYMSGRGARLVALTLTMIFTLAVILSYTRAAWVSLAVALVTYLLFVFKVKFRYIMVAGIAALAVFLVYRQDIMTMLEKNRQDSSANYMQHVQSISNISTDASNVERINRWNCAIRMFKVKPWFGWGPGTYTFKYAPFQRSNEMTIISTNAGNRGNAHSEYIGPLAESGLFGALTFLAIILTIIYKGSMLYIRSNDREVRLLSMGILLGLITYAVHGIMNNFLDTDKASVPFWGFAAMLVALEVYHPRKTSEATAQH